MNFNQISYPSLHWKGSKHNMYQTVQWVLILWPWNWTFK